jgi:cellulose synthase operon protein C
MAGAASLSLGQATQAERHLERAIAIEPGNVAARKLLAQTRLGLQSPERALEALGPAMGDGGDPALAALAGVAQVRAGDAEAAIETFRRQLEKDPRNEETRAMLAVSLMAAGRTEEALAELAKIQSGAGVMRLRADLIGIAAHLQAEDHLAARSLAAKMAQATPGDAALYSTLGGLFQASGQLDEAAVWFEETLAVAPNNTAAAYNLASINASRGQVDLAATQFEAILKREPNNAAALSARAQIDWARGEREAAIQRLGRARAADPADANSRFVLAQYLVSTGKAAEAVAVATELVKIAPEVAAAANSLGLALLESGQPAEALPQFERARKLDALDARYLFNSARAHAVLGEGDAARTHLVNALALEPENPTLLAALVELERRGGRLEAAALALRRLELAAPANDVRVAVLRGEVRLGQQQYAEAEQAFGEALRLGAGSRAVVGQFEARRRGAMPEAAAPLLTRLGTEPGDTFVRAMLAEYYLGGNDQPAAIREYETLLETSPDNALFLNNLAWLYSEAGNPRSLELATRAHELAPDNAMIADTLGWILHQKGEHERARELLASAVAGAPQSGDIRYRYAVVLAETGDRAGAIREARMVLADTGAVNYHDPAQKLLTRLEQGRE